MSQVIESLRIKIFADGADIESILALNEKGFIKGFTTNPTLMKKAGVSDYLEFAKELVVRIPDKPISFEVFADDIAEMEHQAHIIAAWAPNVYVKIPITNTQRQSTFDVVQRLTASGIKVNVTAIMTLQQIAHIAPAFNPNIPGVISVFAGRIADTGHNPVPIMKAARDMLVRFPHLELLWASPRQVLDIFHADEAGADIITVTHDLLQKLAIVGYDLDTYSLDTVKMFYRDGKELGYELSSTTCEPVDAYLNEVGEIISTINRDDIRSLISALSQLRERGGRLFILGVGGSSANASHAVNDFRKICGIEAYAPTDNMSEFSAWTNDKGFEYVFSEWLSESHFCQKDAVFILSVGGGTQTISQNLVGAMHYAKERGGQVFGIVSRDGGMTRKMADVSILVPVISDERITPHAEEWQAVLWHMMTAILGKKNDSPVASAEESVVPAAFGSVSMTQ